MKITLKAKPGESFWISAVESCCKRMSLELFGNHNPRFFLRTMSNGAVETIVCREIEGGSRYIMSLDHCPYCGRKISETRRAK